MKITFLGTNGWFSTPSGNTSCVLIETNDKYFVLDAGDGFYKLKHLITKSKPVYLFFSHYHIDHIIGLHTLAIMNFDKGLYIYGPFGLKNLSIDILKKPYTRSINKHKFKVEINEINDNSNFDFLKLGFEFKTLKLDHSVNCYGYRFKIDGKIVSYCTDTKKCNNINILSKNANVLITESSFFPNKKEKGVFHMTPEEAAKCAKESNVKMLLLTHFSGILYKTQKDRYNAQESARHIFQNSYSMFDGMEINV